MGATTLSKAIRAVTEVLLVNRLQQHRHRSLDQLVLECRLADRTLPSILLFAPDALYWGCLIAPAAHALMQVAQIFVEVVGILLRRHPIAPRGTRLTRLAIRLPEKVDVDQVGER